MRVLHLTFHVGCANAIDNILRESVDLTTRIVTSGVDGFYYNMTHERADLAWGIHNHYFNEFDAVVVSDTVPLARILLQGGYGGKVIICATNRFDYYDSREKGFPDRGYYKLMQDASRKDNVWFTANNMFDKFYAEERGVNVCDVIKFVSKPTYNKKKQGYYVPTYSNDVLLSLYDRCVSSGLDVKTGRYKDMDSLAGYKTVVHLPYTWCSIALFDALACGCSYYVPTKRFILELIKETKGYWFQNANYCPEHIDLCEFYNEENSVFIKYFDHFWDMQPIEPDSNEIYNFAEKEYYKYKELWKSILGF